VLSLLPLLGALALCSTVVLDRLDRRVRLALTRVALALFGDYVGSSGRRQKRQLARMRAARVAAAHRAYASRTLLFSGVYGVAGAVVGVYVAGWLVSALGAERAPMAALPTPFGFVANLGNLSPAVAGELFLLLALSGSTVGAALAAGAYWGRWKLLDSRAHARARAIETTLPRTVAFVYALSRSGMPLPAVLHTLAENREVYGEAAAEFGTTVRDMETFGTDVLTALERTGQTTPSDGLGDFAGNLGSVLGSGRSVAGFLREQYDRFQSRAETRQARYIELLAAFAEMYVTVLVAGPLFLVTILAVIGLVLTDTLPLVRLVVYAVLPLATAGFAVYVDSMTGTLQTPTDGGGAAADTDGGVAERDVGPETAGPTTGAAGSPAVADGGVAAADGNGRVESRRRLALNDRFAPLRRTIADPVGTLFDRPAATLALTVPVALGWVMVRAGRAALGALTEGNVTAALGALDEPLIQGVAVVLAAFALVHEFRSRRRRATDAAVPALLDRLASLDEAGMTLVGSLRRVAENDTSALAPELERTWRDVRLGAEVTEALQRFDRRVDSASVTRTVALVTNAARASGDIAPVLRIAADEAQTLQRLREERRQEMLTYLLVIYVAFFVFLAIVVALLVAFIPSIEAAQVTGSASAGAASGVGSGGPLGSLDSVGTDAYAQAFFHAAAIQALCSGALAGQLGEGRVADGAKHALLMLLAAYATKLAVPALTDLWRAAVV
jgi:flagellar protein FlaJ